MTIFYDNKTLCNKTNFKQYINLNQFKKPLLKEQKDFNFIEWLEIFECFYFESKQVKIKQKFNKDDIKSKKIFSDYNLNDLDDFQINLDIRQLLNKYNFIDNFIKQDDVSLFIDNLIFETSFNSVIKTLIRFLIYLNENKKELNNLDDLLDFIDYEEEKQQRYLKDIKKIRNKKKEEYVLLELNKLKYKDDLLIKESKDHLIRTLKVKKSLVKYKEEVNEDDLLNFI